MSHINSIMVATDFSGPASSAVQRAARLAAQHRARLSMVHVIETPRFLAWRDVLGPPRDLRQAAARAHAILAGQADTLAAAHDIGVDVEVLVGDPVEALWQAVGSAGLLVLGQRQGGLARDLILSHTADQLLNKSRRPILVVKSAGQSPYQRVLVPVDFTPRSEVACTFAATLAPAAHLHLFHSLPTWHETKLRLYDVPGRFILDHRARLREGARKQMAGVVQRACIDADRVELHFGLGDAWHTALQHESAIAADLIVVGKQWSSAWTDFMLGSMTRRLLAKSVCDIMVIPSQAVLIGSGAVPSPVPGQLDAAGSR